MKKKLYWALIVVFAAIFLVSGYIVVDYLIDDYNHSQMMDGLPTYPTESRPVTGRPIHPTTGRPTLPPTTGPVNPTTGPVNPTTGPVNPTTGPVNPTQPTVPTVPTQPTVPTVPTVPTQPPAPTVPSILADILPYYEINQDVVGYIYIPGTKINYPVLQSKGRPNFYIDKDIYGNPDVCGSIYVREACDVFQPSDNVTLYGHHMASGRMFANVMNYAWSRDFFDSHPYIYFDTLYEKHVYQVVCVFKTSGTYGVGFPYHLYDDFTNEEEFHEFVNGVRSRAIHDSGIPVQYGDKFICLSTCEYTIENGRMVLVAVRIS